MSLTLNVAIVAEIFRSEIVRLFVLKSSVLYFERPIGDSLSHGGLEGPSHFDIFPLEHFLQWHVPNGHQKENQDAVIEQSRNSCLSEFDNSFSDFYTTIKK